MSTSTEGVGKLSGEWEIAKEITWKIPNAFSLPKSVDCEVQSPPFSFANATWCLQIYPKGQTEEDSEGYIDLMIVRTSSPVLEHDVSCDIYIRTRHGTEFNSSSAEEDFATDWPEKGGVTKYMKRSEFYAKKNLIAPNGILTVICRMEIKGFTEVEAHSLTKRPGSDEDNTSFAAGEMDAFPDKWFRNFTWEIPDVYSVGDRAQSSLFAFAKVLWCLRMSITRPTLLNPLTYIDLTIVRIQSAVPEQDVFYKIFFKTPSGNEFEKRGSTRDLVTKSAGKGGAESLKKTHMMTRLDLIALNGALTVICQLRAKKETEVEAYSQTELLESFQDVVKEPRLPDTFILAA